MRFAIRRRRQEVHDRVEQGLNALVLERRAAQHRMERATLHGGADQATQGRIIGLLAVEIGHHRVVVHFDGRFDELAAIFLRLIDFRSAGISPSSNFAPRDSPCQTIPFILTRSMTPLKSLSAPIGS